MVNKLNKSFYNTVLSQVFSPCGNYLIVGDIYGTISIFHLSKLINQETSISREEQKPKHSFIVKEDVQINSLLLVSDILIVGTVGEIFGYYWKNIKSTNKKIVCSWTIQIPNSKDGLDKSEVNCMIFNEDLNIIFAGCGDGNIYAFNIENGQNVRTLKGHKDYIHSLAQSKNTIISGGEDGLVHLWDIRNNALINRIEPHLKEKIGRADLGKWVGGVDISEDWLLCGGGPRLSLWHLRSMNPSTVFPIDDKGIHVAEIYKDKIFGGGRSDFFYQMSFNGDILTEIRTSAVTTYSVVHQEQPFQALCLGGSSPKIDVCSNFMYKNLQLSLY